MNKILSILALFFISIQIAGGYELNQNRTAGSDSTSLRVERIEISGNSKTRDTVILRHLTFKPNDPIDATLIEQNYRHLVNTRFFKKVQFYTRPGSQKGLVVVEIEVTERSWPTLHVEGGYSEFDGWYLSPLTVRYDNPLGNGYNFGLVSYVGDQVSGIGLQVQGDYLFNSKYRILAEFFGRGHNYRHTFPQETWEHKVAMSGIKLDIGAHSGPLKLLTIRLQHKRVVPEKKATILETGESTAEFPAIIARDTSAAVIGSVVLILSADTRNNSDYPTHGFWGSVSLEAANERREKRFRYRTFIADGRFYFRPTKRHALATRFKFGLTDDETPYYERFYLGGATSIRGFSVHSLTPVGWGTKLALMNLEYRIPLSTSGFPRHRWTGSLFVDIGGIWQNGEPVDYRDLFSAWGFGLRFRLPVLGLVRIDLGLPLTRKRGLVHLALGHTF